MITIIVIMAVITRTISSIIFFFLSPAVIKIPCQSNPIQAMPSQAETKLRMQTKASKNNEERVGQRESEREKVR